MLEQLRLQRKFPCLATCDRWIIQFNEEGHTRCKRPTGNHISQREVHGQDLFNLSLYRMVRPKAYLDKVRAYVHNQNPENPPYSQSHIYRAERRLRLVRKAASTTSDCASAKLPYPAVIVEPPRSVLTAAIAQSNSKYWSVIIPV